MCSKGLGLRLFKNLPLANSLTGGLNPRECGGIRRRRRVRVGHAEVWGIGRGETCVMGCTWGGKRAVGAGVIGPGGRPSAVLDACCSHAKKLCRLARGFYGLCSKIPM